MDGPATTGEEIKVGGKLEVMDPTGHFEVRWGKKQAEIDLAETTFKDYLAKGYKAYKKTIIGRKGRETETFDPKAGCYIFEASEEPKKPTRPNDLAAKGEPVEDENVEHEPTKELDKNADTTMVPPLRGG